MEKGILNSRRIRHRYDSVVLESVGSFGWYQIRLFFITQLPYLVVPGSLLCTLFDNIIPDRFCDTADAASGLANGIRDNGSLSLISNLSYHKNVSTDSEFRSLIVDLGLACRSSYFPTFMVTSVMGGGTVGATIFGYLADRYGRRSSSVIALLGIGVANGTLLASVHLHWSVAVMILFVLGAFGAGYMVVSLVLVLENVGKSWRLFCVSMNGFPLGFMFMAFVAYATGRWYYYHLVLSMICIPGVLGYYFIYESPRWLIQCGRVKEAEAIIEEYCRINGRSPVSRSSLLAKMSENGVVHDSDCNGNGLLGSQEDLQGTHVRKYTYMDLVRVRPVFLRLLSLSYCWFASAVVSFGIYYNMEEMAGNRYLNTFLTGLLKGTTGVIPWIVSPWSGRRPIFIISVIATCISCWAAVLIYSLGQSDRKSVWLTACAILGTAAMDPMWKINHLYSAELFPTVVRNMARAVCNVSSRLGSVIGPQVAFLSSYYFPLPFIIYGTVSIVQVVVTFFLPETKNRPLPDDLPCKPEKKQAGEESNDLVSRAGNVMS